MNKDRTRNLRQALGSFPTGVTVVSCLDKNKNPLGFTANSFTSVSLDPKLISICIDKESFNIDSFSITKHFAISVLSENQQSISTIFATPNEDRFKNIDWSTEETGSPIITNAVAWFDCNTQQVVDAGDHLILIGNIIAFDSTPKTPLMYLRGNYVNLGLEQKMLLAMENENTEIIVGAIIESTKKVLLLEDKKNGSLYFPSASRLGHTDDDESLLGVLNNLNISINEHYLFLFNLFLCCSNSWRESSMNSSVSSPTFCCLVDLLSVEKFVNNFTRPLGTSHRGHLVITSLDK